MEFYIYSFEISKGGKALFNKTTGNKNIDDANHIMNDILKSDLRILLKYKNEDYIALCLSKTNHENVFTWILCTEKDLTAYNGHEKHLIKSYPGCYIIFDNRKDVGQFCVEKSSTCTAKPDDIAKGLNSTFKDKLGEYGLDIIIKKKRLAKTFKEIILDRIYIKKDPVKRVVFDFPNMENMESVDTPSKEFREKLKALSSIIGVKNSRKGKLEMIGDDGNPVDLDDEKTKDFDQLIYLCYNNSYKLTYYFVKSGRICTKDTKVYAIYEIDEAELMDFENNQTAICDGEKFRLIEHLNQIRRDIGDYKNENIGQ